MIAAHVKEREVQSRQPVDRCTDQGGGKRRRREKKQKKEKGEKDKKKKKRYK